MRDRNRINGDGDHWSKDDDIPEQSEWATWQIEGEDQPVNCDSGCDLGYECPCYNDGASDGTLEAERDYPDVDGAVSDALTEARRGIERLFEKILRPIENEAFLKGNEKALVEADKLREMQREIEEILSS